MIAILIIVLPVFALIGIGYFSSRTGFFNDAGIDALNRFSQGLAIPILLFLAISRADLSLFNATLYTTYYIPAALIFLSAGIGAKLLFHRDAQSACSIGFAALFSNSVLIGLPISERAYGTDSLAINYALVAAHAPICYFLGIATMEGLQARGEKISHLILNFVRKIFGNPLMIGILFGLVFNILNIPLVGPIAAALDLFAKSALPVALFALGGILTRYRLKQNLKDTAYVLTFSMIFFPALVWIWGGVTGLSEQALKTAVIMAAMPPGVNIFIFASLYDRAKAVAASSIVIGTALGIFTISAWLHILG